MTILRVLLDSSVWIELLSEGPAKKECLNYFTKAQTIIVPTVIQYEVYRKISSLSESNAMFAIALLNQKQIVPLTTEVALMAADLSLEHKLGMADALILAHSQISQAPVVTLDNDFRQIKELSPSPILIRK